MVKEKFSLHWAIKRALAICGLSNQERRAQKTQGRSSIICAFARYIEEHEVPPPDPPLDEACDVIARCQEAISMTNAAKAARLGKCDNHMGMRLTLVAISRPIELGKQVSRSRENDRRLGSLLRT